MSRRALLPATNGNRAMTKLRELSTASTAIDRNQCPAESCHYIVHKLKNAAEYVQGVKGSPRGCTAYGEGCSGSARDVSGQPD